MANVLPGQSDSAETGGTSSAIRFVHPDVIDKPPAFTGVSCPQSLAGKLSAITERHPTFPFAHFWLAQCALGAGDFGWVQHAERAMAIFRHTTQIEGHHRDHSSFYNLLLKRLPEQQ